MPSPFLSRLHLLALFNTSAPKQEAWYPAYWHYLEFGTPRDGDVSTLFGPEDWSVMVPYVARCREIASQVIDLALVESPVDEVVLAMCRLGADLYADGFGNSATHRPQWALSVAINLPLHFKIMQGKEGPTQPEWLTPEFGLQFMRARIQSHPSDMLKAVGLWLNPPSFGWTGKPEYDEALATIDGLVSDRSRIGVLAFWLHWKGNEADFVPLWDEFVVGMAEVRAEVVRNPPPNEPLRYGDAYYAEMFTRLACPHSFGDFRDAAAQRWALLNEEANRLSKLLGFQTWNEFLESYDFSDPAGPQLLADDQALLAAYRQACDEFEAMCRSGGALDVEWPAHYTMDIQLLGPDQVHSTPTAMLQPGVRGTDPMQPRRPLMMLGGWETLTDPEQARKRQRHQSLMHRVTAAHELVHAWQTFRQAHTVPASWASPAVTGIGQEGGAFCAEILRLLLADPKAAHPALGIAMLQHRLQRLGRVIVEYDFHVGGRSFDDVVADYAHYSGLSLQDARVEATRMTMNPLQFSSYQIGSWAIEAAAEHSFDGDLVVAWKGFLEDTGNFMFPSWWLQASGQVENRLEVPWIPTHCFELELTQRLFEPGIIG